MRIQILLLLIAIFSLNMLIHGESYASTELRIEANDRGDLVSLKDYLTSTWRSIGGEVRLSRGVDVRVLKEASHSCEIMLSYTDSMLIIYEFMGQDHLPEDALLRSTEYVSKVRTNLLIHADLLDAFAMIDELDSNTLFIVDDLSHIIKRFIIPLTERMENKLLAKLNSSHG